MLEQSKVACKCPWKVCQCFQTARLEELPESLQVHLASDSLLSLALSLGYLSCFFTVSEEKETGCVSHLQQNAQVGSSDWVQQNWCTHLKQIKKKNLDFVGPLNK